MSFHDSFSHNNSSISKILCLQVFTLNGAKRINRILEKSRPVRPHFEAGGSTKRFAINLHFDDFWRQEWLRYFSVGVFMVKKNIFLLLLRTNIPWHFRWK